jgi:hypothetical protein
MAELQAFRSMLDAVNELRTRLRGASMPPEDKIWTRHRTEADLLSNLGQIDAKLAASAQLVRTEALSITPAGLADMPGQIEPRLRQLSDLLDQRNTLLNVV